MRVCPKCGYAENPLWQQDKFAGNLMFMRSDDFQREYTDIYEQMRQGKNNIIIGNFMYRMKKGGIYVRRYEIIGGSQATNYEAGTGAWSAKSMSRFIKKTQALKHPNQTKLNDCTLGKEK